MSLSSDNDIDNELSPCILNNNERLDTTTYSNEPEEEDKSSRLKFLEESVARLSKENLWLKEKVSTKIEEMFDVWDRLYHCEISTSNLNQYNRRENIEIAGIPNNIQNYHLEEFVINTLRDIGVNGLSSYEIVACHRLKSKTNSNKPANVIVRFVNRKRAYETLDKFTEMKKRYPNFYKKLYIFENLCPTARKIFNTTRKLMFQEKIKDTWTYEGKIYIIKNNDYCMEIEHINELEELFPDLAT